MGLVPSFAQHWPHPGAEQASEARAQHSPALSQPELYTQKPQITENGIWGFLCFIYEYRFRRGDHRSPVAQPFHRSIVQTGMPSPLRPQKPSETGGAPHPVCGTGNPSPTVVMMGLVFLLGLGAGQWTAKIRMDFCGRGFIQKRGFRVSASNSSEP